MAAGNKKKKKPSANPARGYATTSSISKTKLESNDETTSTAHSDVTTPEPTSTPAGAQGIDPEKPTSGSELQELSPEELEAHLEASELQALVEKYGPRIKKDSSRHAQRLRTERRVLRGQADYLSVKQWLPDELMEDIVSLIQLDCAHEVTAGKPLNLSSKDELLSEIWNLRMVLLELGISLPRTNEVIAHLLQNGELDYRQSCLSNMLSSLCYRVLSAFLRFQLMQMDLMAL